ncbi:MAG: T9SS type A sorting domain-containing protein [Flavobacteriales bacterium]|nr:T9SS type A sorting domain-containing protein [Flavobacteriales bacterium]
MKFLALSAGFLFINLIGTQAQESTNATGGNFSGNGGSVSYSIGQVVYETYSAATGSVAQGVQQAYEISAINGIEISEIVLQMSAYPNPTTDFLNLLVGNYKSEKLSLELYDVSGRLLFNQTIMEANTVVDMNRLPTATYYLNIIDNQKLIKTFKIIKS